jgi:hypothetical protein
MDYSGLINLVLATIIYSTFIAPNIQKLDKLREDIIDVEFPVADEEDYDDNVLKAGVQLNKKMTRYDDKYNEVKQFLRYFYWIVAAIFAVQIVVFLNSKSVKSTQFASLLIALIVVVVLTLTLRRYLVEPWKVRSIPWLASKGVAPVYLTQIYDAQLTLNQKTSNGLDDDELTRISIVSAMKLVGFRYILTVENLEGDRLYYVSAGLISKHIISSDLISRSAKGTTYELQLARIKLKENNYQARLLMFDSAFGGKYNPRETILKFSVEPTNSGIPPKKVNLAIGSSKVEIRISKQRIKSYIVKEGQGGDHSIVSLLTSRNFQKLLSRTNRPFILESYNGNLDRYEINKYCSRKSLLINRLKRMWRPWKNAKYRNLIPLKNR